MSPEDSVQTSSRSVNQNLRYCVNHSNLFPRHHYTIPTICIISNEKNSSVFSKREYRSERNPRIKRLDGFTEKKKKSQRRLTFSTECVEDPHNSREDRAPNKQFSADARHQHNRVLNKHGDRRAVTCSEDSLRENVGPPPLLTEYRA